MGQPDVIKTAEATKQLLKGVRNGDADMVKEAMGKGADVNLHDRDGMTPIMNAVMFLDLDVVDVLAKSGKAKVTDEDMKTATKWVKSIGVETTKSLFLERLQAVKDRLDANIVSREVENPYKQASAILKNVGLSAQDAGRIAGTLAIDSSMKPSGPGLAT